jgi:hypothetical protein
MESGTQVIMDSVRLFRALLFALALKRIRGKKAGLQEKQDLNEKQVIDFDFYPVCHSAKDVFLQQL